MATRRAAFIYRIVYEQPSPPAPPQPSQPKQLVIKSMVVPGYTINSINVEYINGEDILYINSDNGIVRAFSLTCSGTISDKDIIASDYVSGSCGSENLFAGNDTDLLEVISGSIGDTFELCNNISEVLYYSW